jgi:rubrerythrin
VNKKEAETALLKLLNGAYSGELAAALAYEGHHISVRGNFEEKKAIFKIMGEEIHHRERLEKMILELGGEINEKLEHKMLIIGTAISYFCKVGRYLPLGWFFSMYGAGRLESKNVKEYEDAARYAWFAGKHHFILELLSFAEIEWEHEKYFRKKVKSHFLDCVMPHWNPPSSKDQIKLSFYEFTEA